tara:strand:- start:198 stop:1841 length:1644 start_codon:yes stop_codon:yes gene_type:complete
MSIEALEIAPTTTKNDVETGNASGMMTTKPGAPAQPQPPITTTATTTSAPTTSTKSKGRLERTDTVHMNMTHIKYEKNPFVTWKAMVFNLISSLFGVLFLAITCALYPIYAFAIPRQVWTFLGEKGFGILYYIFANSNVLRYFHLRSIAKKHENDNGDVLRSIHSFTQTEMLSSAAVIPIPFLSDNYSYLIVDRQSKTAAVVDPSDPISALGVAQRVGVELKMILCTHKHHDHAGGNVRLKELMKNENLPVYAHKLDNCHGATHFVEHGDVIRLGEDVALSVLHLPCHTKGHIAFALHMKGSKNVESSDESTVEALFCGDVILNGGVGAFFEGCAKECALNLHKTLQNVPDSCLIFSGHEYMTMNLRFATYLDDDDDFTRLVLNTIVLTRNRSLATQPSSMKVERYANPFFRIRERAYAARLLLLRQKLQREAKRPWWRRYVPESRNRIGYYKELKSESILLDKIQREENAYNGTGGVGHAMPSKFIEDEDDLTMLIEVLKHVLTSGRNEYDFNEPTDSENIHFNDFMNALKAENDPNLMNRRIHQL